MNLYCFIIFVGLAEAVVAVIFNVTKAKIASTKLQLFNCSSIRKLENLSLFLLLKFKFLIHIFAMFKAVRSAQPVH